MRNSFLIAVMALLVACSAPTTWTPTNVAAPAPTLTAPTVTPLYLARLGAVERDITYCIADGVELKMDVHYPQTMSKPAPVAVYVHGGSWSSGSKSDGFGMTDETELLARGYLVVSVDYRLAPQWKFPAQIQDVKCAIRFLRANAARFNLDPHRIGAWGNSAGGHLVALLGTTDPSAGFEGSGGYPDQSSRIQAVVDMCGRADLRGMPADRARSVFGATDNNSDVLLRASPITFISNGDAPFLILHGDKDGTVPPPLSQTLYDRLKAASVPATLVTVKNADHSFNPVDGVMSPTRAELS
jgi:acetyl esterase/lipase